MQNPMLTSRDFVALMPREAQAELLHRIKAMEAQERQLYAGIERELKQIMVDYTARTSKGTRR